MLLVSGIGAVHLGYHGSAEDAAKCLHGVVRDLLVHVGHGTKFTDSPTHSMHFARERR